MERCYNLLEATQPTITAAMVKERYMLKPVVHRTFTQAFKLHNIEVAELVSKKKGAIGTLKRYERLEKKVLAFLKKKYKINDLPLERIEMALATNFYHHMIMDDIEQ